MNADAAQANMHYDVQGNKWIFENPETGEEMEWNEAANAWVPVLDEEVVKAQQAAYSVAGVDEAVSQTKPGALTRDSNPLCNASACCRQSD